MNVLMTADAVGGVWTYALDLARGLAEHGVRTTLAVLGPPPGVDRRAAAATVSGLAVVETGLALDWTAASPEEVVAAGRQLAGLARAVSADLVHLNAPAYAAGAGFDRPVLGVCHSCVQTWWDAVEGGPLPPDLAWRADLVRQGCRAVDALIAPSAAFADATAAAYGLARPPSVVHNGRRPPPAERTQGPAERAFSHVPHAEVAGGAGPRSMHGRGASFEADLRSAPQDEAESGHLERFESGTQAGQFGDRFVFTAGRLWDRGKNVATLDRAAARLALPVLAAGPTRGPNGDTVALRSARPLGNLADRVVAEHLARGPVFVSLALYEPFGLAVLEAAQAGCPLVLSDIPTFRELWDGAAVFVPAEDEDSIVREIDGLVADPARATDLGRAARSRSVRYGIDAMVSGTLAAYVTLRSERSAAA